jgi:hypothetical protein
VSGPVATAAITVSLLMGAWCLVLLVINRPPGRALLIGLTLLEAVVLVFVVSAISQMIGRSTDFARLEFLLYLLGCLVLVPLAAWWVKDEKSRAAAGVLLVACLVLPVMVVRVQQVWDGVSA